MADKICLPLTTPLLLHKARCGASSRWKHLPLSRNWWKMHSLHNCLSINIASHHLCLALNLSRSNTVQYHMNQYETAAVQFLSASYLEASVPFCKGQSAKSSKGWEREVAGLESAHSLLASASHIKTLDAAASTRHGAPTILQNAAIKKCAITTLYQNSCILQDKISMLSASESFWIFIQNLLEACTQRHIWHEPCALCDQANSGTCHDA